MIYLGYFAIGAGIIALVLLIGAVQIRLDRRRDSWRDRDEVGI